MKHKVVIGVLAAIIILGGGYWYFSQNKAAAPETQEIIGDVPNDRDEQNEINTDATTNTTPSTDKIVVSAQLPGSDITVDNISLSKPGFVVVYELDSAGRLGKVVGTSNYLTAGNKQDLEVKATVVANRKYSAVLYVDNGDKKFDAATDAQAKDANEYTASSTFSVGQ